MLKPLVSVVAFKKVAVSIPLKGDLQTQINFPTGLHRFETRKSLSALLSAYSCRHERIDLATQMIPFVLYFVELIN